MCFSRVTCIKATCVLVRLPCWGALDHDADLLKAPVVLFWTWTWNKTKTSFQKLFSEVTFNPTVKVVLCWNGLTLDAVLLWKLLCYLAEAHLVGRRPEAIRGARTTERTGRSCRKGNSGRMCVKTRTPEIRIIMIMQISKCGNLSGINQKPIIAIEGRHTYFTSQMPIHLHRLWKFPSKQWCCHILKKMKLKKNSNLVTLLVT